MKRNVLIITLHYLDGVGGGVFATRAYANAFAEIIGDQGTVTMLYPAAVNHSIEGIDARIKAIPVYDNATKWFKFFNLLRGQVHRYNTVFKEILAKERYDIVIFDNSRVSFKLIDIAHKHGAKVITIHHNCELEYNRDNATSLIKPIMLFWTKKYESEAAKKSDLSLVLTPEDKNLLIEKYSLSSENADKIKILGVFESEQRELPEIKKSSISQTIDNFIITGNLGAKQSNESLIQWLNIYYPIFKSVFPHANLVIAGKNPSEELKHFCQNLDIKLIVSPPSMVPFLEKADCYICPTSLGGGLKLRVMDGLKYGLPVITHSVSARGYHDFVKQRVVIPYDSVESFISACRNIKDSTCNKETIQNLYSRIFSFKSGCKRLSEFIE